MIKYTLFRKNPASHYVYIDLIVDNVSTPQLQLQLPAWRPGRYELGNFAKNVKRLEAFSHEGIGLPYIKRSKDLWEIETKGSSVIKVTYSYYAAEMTAGSCFSDDSQLYMNPVHCCMYVPDRMEDEHVVELKVPEDYKIVSSLTVKGNILTAKNFDELADSPFIAGAEIQSRSYKAQGIEFHIHFNGECRPDWDKILGDFSKFTEKQIAFWGDYPYDEFHFLFQMLPYKYHHGVEHKKNTVIAIGPSYAMNSWLVYEDILGISSHELFHVWNVKTIRPVEMLPYDFTKENYASTGFVYEGFTTYYGDKILLSCGVFSLEQYFITLQERLQRHIHNYGRYNLSVAQGSYDTWLDGYVPGAPYRKTSIYDEGCLIAFILDVQILEATSDKKSLRHVCQLLYERFGKQGKGYSEEDIIILTNEVSGKDMRSFFETYVFSHGPYDDKLEHCFTYLGLTLEMPPSGKSCEHIFGFKVSENLQAPFSKVSLVAPYSPAWKCGLFAGDEIIAVNNKVLNGNLNEWLNYYGNENEVILTVNSNGQLKEFKIQKETRPDNYFFTPVLSLLENQKDNKRLMAWKEH